MWQRKQTIYLLLSAILLIGLQVLPVCLLMPSMMGMPKEIYCLRIYDININQNVFGLNSILFAITLVAIFDSIATIFLYNNRKLQMMLCRSCQAMMVLWYILLAVVIYLDKDGGIQMQFGGIIPIVCLIVYQLAYKGIKHDEDLVRSADRIR